MFLWYKKGQHGAITRIQLTYNEKMKKGLNEAKYTMVKHDLNSGTGGDNIHLWYYKGTNESDVPIVDLFISTEREDEAQLFHLGWEKLACNMNRRTGGAYRIYLWVKRAQPTYINSIKVTSGFDKDASLFKDGYIRLDENTNRAAGGSSVFIWYLLTKNSQNAIRDLKVGDILYKPPQHYQKLDQDLNEGTGGVPLFLFYTTVDDGNNAPINTMSLIVKKIGVEAYKRANVHVLEPSLNEGNDGANLFVCFY